MGHLLVFQPGCVNTSLLFLEVKKKQEKEGALPTKSRGCRDGGKQENFRISEDACSDHRF